MIVAVMLSSEAVAALLGAAVGAVGSWGLAIVRDSWQARKNRRVAALLVTSELTGISGALYVLRNHGVASPPLTAFTRPMWESTGTALLHGWDLERVGIIATAYTTAADIAAICQEPGRNFTQGADALVVDHAQTQVIAALREVLRLTGLDEKETDRRMEIAQARHRGAQ